MPVPQCLAYSKCSINVCFKKREKFQDGSGSWGKSVQLRGENCSELRNSVLAEALQFQLRSGGKPSDGGNQSVKR